MTIFTVKSSVSFLFIFLDFPEVNNFLIFYLLHNLQTQWLVLITDSNHSVSLLLVLSFSQTHQTIYQIVSFTSTCVVFKVVKFWDFTRFSRVNVPSPGTWDAAPSPAKPVTTLPVAFPLLNYAKHSCPHLLFSFSLTFYWGLDSGKEKCLCPSSRFDQISFPMLSVLYTVWQIVTSTSSLYVLWSPCVRKLGR